MFRDHNEERRTMPQERRKAERRGDQIAVWGTFTWSPWELSDGLRRLKVTHTVDPQTKGEKVRRLNMKHDQPLPVHLTTTLKGLRTGAVNFIATSYSNLSGTNIPLMPKPSGQAWDGVAELDLALRHCLTSSRLTSLELASLSVVDFIHMVAKPSLLNKIETEILRIQPYSLRKEVKAMVLNYFNSRCSQAQVSKFLAKSLKFDLLRSFILSGSALRDAISRHKAGEDAEAISATTGVPAFDILYMRAAGNPKPKKEKVKTQ